MEIIQASYLISSPSVDKCPEPKLPEYAFIGRSNVGKSSVINMLCKKKELARVSSSPGKTQMINHYEVKTSGSQTWWLVDLPGYGYAKRSLKERKSWEKMIEGYIKQRTNLCTLFVLIDSRHEPQQLDLDFVNKLGEWRIPFAIIFTKSDKSTQKEVARHVGEFGKALLETWEELPPYFVTSAEKHTGSKPILAYISDHNQTFLKHKNKGV